MMSSTINARRTPALSTAAIDNERPTLPAGPGAQSSEPSSKRPKRTLKLTASQRERKRAIDREAQRSIRLKTKNYIAHLENLVQIMEKGGSNANGDDGGQDGPAEPATGDGEERARELLSQLRQSQEEVRKLQETVSGVQRLVNGGRDWPSEAGPKRLMFPEPPAFETSTHTFAQGAMLNPLSHFDNPASVYSHSSDSSSLVDLAHYPLPEPPRSTEASAPPPRSGGPQPHFSEQKDRFDSYGRVIPAQPVPEQPLFQNPPDAVKHQVEGELFLFSDSQVNRVLAGGQRSFTNQPLDEDIIVRAVLHGWREVQDQYVLDSGWQALKGIDQVIFGECGVVERMAILRTMRSKLLHQSHGNSSSLPPLPQFFQRSSLEDPALLQTMPVIEHFVWPGLRRSLCMNRNKYLTNRFSDAFRRSLKFLWPYSVSDAYVRDPNTQLYSIASEFRERQMDIRAWTMRKDFFEGANELFSAIPVYDVPLDRALVPAGSLSMPRRRERPVSVGRVEEQEVEESPIDPMPPPASAVQYSVSSTLSDIPVAMMHPHSSEIEQWLGDADMVPQYWNLEAGMNVEYGAQWSGVSRAFAG